MNLVILHGAPATGKFTVGRELAALTGYRFFHNHLVVDAVLAIYDFGTPGFVELREKIWRDVLGRAARDEIPGVIFTFSAENTVAPDFVDWLFAGLPPARARVLSVALTASESGIEARMGGASRHEHGKLTDVTLYRRLRDGGAFRSPVIPRVDLTVDTEEFPATESARRIGAAFGLP